MKEPTPSRVSREGRFWGRQLDLNLSITIAEYDQPVIGEPGTFTAIARWSDRADDTVVTRHNLPTLESAVLAAKQQALALCMKRNSPAFWA